MNCSLIGRWVSTTLVLLAMNFIVGATSAAPIVQPTSFTPITTPTSGGPWIYTQGAAGWTVQQKFYNNGIVFNNTTAANYNIVTSGTPAANTTSALFPGQASIDYGGGNVGTGGLTANLAFPAGIGGGNEFSLRANGFVEFATAGTYSVTHGADDTTYVRIQTLADGTLDFSSNCCGGGTNTFTITQPGLFPVDFVFVEDEGGEWVDLVFRNAGGQTLPVFAINAQALPEPASVAIWSLIAFGFVGFGCYRYRRQK